MSEGECPGGNVYTRAVAAHHGNPSCKASSTNVSARTSLDLQRDVEAGSACRPATRVLADDQRAARRPIVFPSLARSPITTADEIKYGRRPSVRPSTRAGSDDRVVTEGRIVDDRA